MVERVRNGIGFLAAFLLELFAAYTHNPQDDETPEEDSVTAIHEGQRTEIAPPPPPRVFEPMQQFDPSPWYDEIAEDAWEIATA
jgi:hypothetical protein